MATQALRNLRWSHSDAGSQGPLSFYDANIKEANSQSFVVGDLVTATPGTGTVSIFAAQGRNVSGIAETDATNVTSGNIAIRIQKILPTEVYIANLYNGASATTSAITQLGKCYGLRKASAGVWVVDTAVGGTITQANVQVVGFVYGYDVDSSGNPYGKALGDTCAEVYIKFMTNDGTNNNILDFGGC